MARVMPRLTVNMLLEMMLQHIPGVSNMLEVTVRQRFILRNSPRADFSHFPGSPWTCGVSKHLTNRN